MANFDFSMLLLVVVIGYVFTKGYTWIHVYGASSSLVKWLVRKKFWWDFERRLLNSSSFFSSYQDNGRSPSNEMPLHYPTGESLYLVLWQELFAVAAGLSIACLAPPVLIWIFLLCSSLLTATLSAALFVIAGWLTWGMVRNLPW
jgi:hypothetical protein